MVKKISSGVIITLLLMLLTAIPTLADYDYQYENRTSGEDANAEAYGDNWLGQVFTAESSHSVSEVPLLIYREGSPGTLTLSLRDADSNEPTGGTDDNIDLTSATYDGDTVTTSTSGEWITFEFSPEVDIGNDGDYALVLRAVAGDSSNSIHWLYDSTSTVGDDNYASSTDAGDSWTANTGYDFLYDIYGFESLAIEDIAIFSSVMEDGDWLILYYYRATISPYYPGSNVTELLTTQLYETDTPSSVAKTALPAWGYKPGGMYLSENQVDYLSSEYGFTWGYEGELHIQDEDADIDTSATLYSGYWAGSDLWLIDEWMRTVAQDMENYYGEGYFYTESVETDEGEITFDEDEGILTSIGGDVFMTGIPGIEEIRPEMFYYVYHEQEVDELTYDPDYMESTTWEAMVGPQIATWLTSGGDLVNVDGNMFGCGLVLFIYVITVGAVVYKLRESEHSTTVAGSIATGLSIPVIMSGAYLRLVSWELVAILCAVMMFLTVWFIFLSRT